MGNHVVKIDANLLPGVETLIEINPLFFNKKQVVSEALRGFLVKHGVLTEEVAVPQA